MPSLREFEAAAERLRGTIVRTPLVPLAAETAREVWIKPETLQPTGSFKVRGVLNAVDRMDQATRARGLSTVSAGNTAKALAWCGRRFGVPARSLMPEGAPAAKIEAVRALGGMPVLVPTEQVFRFLRERQWVRESFAFVHPWTDPDLHAGHGSMGLEILADLPDVDTVFIPVGGGGLLAGVGGALKASKPSLRIVAVEPEGCPSFHASRRAGRSVTVDCRTICDGVAVPYVAEELFPLLSELADDVVLVTEDEVRAAIRLLATSSHLVAEGAGALAVAAALKTPASVRGRCVCPVTGGSIDADKLAAILG
jgi:threonine dehydratase